MPDQTIASLEVQYGVDTKRLQAGIASAQKHMRGFEGAVGGLDKRLEKATKTLDQTENAHAALGKMGIRTRASIDKEIAALDELAMALQDDEHAMTQVIARKAQLQASLENTAKTHDRLSSAQHRGNLFMINFSRGIEDLKFGLPAVINNLDSIALGFEAMAKEAKAANKSVTSVLLSSLTSPAGILAVMNLVITAAFLLGPTLKKAFNKGRVGAKALKRAVDDALEVRSSAAAEQFFAPATLEQAEELRDRMKEAAQTVKDDLLSGYTAVSRHGELLNVKMLDAVGMLGEQEKHLLNQLRVYEALEKSTEQTVVQMRAAGITAEFLANELQRVAPGGSMNEMNKALDEVEEKLSSTADLAQKLASGDGAARLLVWDRAAIENSIEYAESLMHVKGSMAALRAEADFLASEHERLGGTFMTAAKAAEIAGAQVRVDVVDAYNEAQIALRKFKVESAFNLGGATVNGLFSGIFGSLDSGDADKARLALIDLNKEFVSLEESLASGDISYEEFAIKNRMRMEEVRKAQAELALATRNNFELMAERIGNAFDGLAKSVRGAFKQIAQDYVNLLVRRGIAKLIGNIILPGAGGSTVSAFMGGAQVASGINPALRMAIDTNATVLPSGDLRIAVEQAGAIRSRTGV